MTMDVTRIFMMMLVLVVGVLTFSTDGSRTINRQDAFEDDKHYAFFHHKFPAYGFGPFGNGIGGFGGGLGGLGGGFGGVGSNTGANNDGATAGDSTVQSGSTIISSGSEVPPGVDASGAVNGGVNGGVNGTVTGAKGTAGGSSTAVEGQVAAAGAVGSP